MNEPTRCRNHSRATKIGQRTWKRKALCSNGVPCRSRIRKRIRPSSDSSSSSLRRAKLTRAPLATERSSAIASSRRTKPWSRTRIVFSGITSAVTATPASLAGLYVGTSGWSYPSWKPGFYAAGHQVGGLPPLLRGALPDGRAEHDGLPPASRGAVRAVGRADAARLPLRPQAERTPALRLRHVRRAGRAAGRAARPDPRRRGRRPRRGPADARCSAPSIRRSRWRWISATSRGTASKPSSRRMPYA